MKPATLLLAAVLTCCTEPRSQPLGPPFLDNDKFLPEDFCMDDETREQVRKMMLHGLNDALENHLEALWATWMRDHTQQPERAARGMRLGIDAYLRSRNAALKWNPQC
jgi:hypothetical protein